MENGMEIHPEAIRLKRVEKSSEVKSVLMHDNSYAFLERFSNGYESTISQNKISQTRIPVGYTSH